MKDWFEHAHQVGQVVEVVCSKALYSCCGKGYLLREGYEQVYRGLVHAVGEDVMIVAMGIGTVTYTVRIAWADIADYQESA